MSLRYEWRSRSDDDHNLLVVEEDSGRVLSSWRGERSMLRDFLNEMIEVRALTTAGFDANVADPSDFGILVISRSAEGDVLWVDPELYWSAISTVFRAHGEDPHVWRRHPH